MKLQHLWLTDFRSYASVEVDFAAGLTVLLGANGEGKTNLMEAVATWRRSRRSGAPRTRPWSVTVRNRR